MTLSFCHAHTHTDIHVFNLSILMWNRNLSMICSYLFLFLLFRLKSLIQSSSHLNLSHLKFKTQHFYCFVIVKSTRAIESYRVYIFICEQNDIVIVSQTNERKKLIKKTFHVHSFFSLSFFNLFFFFLTRST